ncbi:MAG: hypothetical protein IT428_03915 [Planctomycetaceae bacterium]|nr:hypothetical protein [Planctomycetaceae bacterium]
MRRRRFFYEAMRHTRHLQAQQALVPTRQAERAVRSSFVMAQEEALQHALREKEERVEKEWTPAELRRIRIASIDWAHIRARVEHEIVTEVARVISEYWQRHVDRLQAEVRQSAERLLQAKEDRGRVIQAIGECLKALRDVVVFPEGERSDEYRHGFRDGASQQGKALIGVLRAGMEMSGVEIGVPGNG